MTLTLSEAASGAQSKPSTTTGHVLCVTQTPDERPIVPVHPGTVTRWVFADPVVNYSLGIQNDYHHQIDKSHRKWLNIKPHEDAEETNLVVQSSKTQTFWLLPVDDPTKAVDRVIIHSVDPITGDVSWRDECPRSEQPRALGDDRTTANMKKRFEDYPAKVGVFEAGGYKIVGRISRQHREGDTLKCRYTLENEGRGYPLGKLQVFPLGSNRPLENVRIDIDDDDGARPFDFHEGRKVKGSIYVKEGAERLEDGFVLSLFPFSLESRVPKADVEFRERQRQLSIQGQVYVGRTSLGSRADLDDTDFASHVAAGVRLVYRLSKDDVGLPASFSAEIVPSLLLTTKAEFSDRTTTRAITTRVLIGGVMHMHAFGEKVVPHLRAGLGSHLSYFAHSEVDDSNPRTGLLLYGSGGVDIRARDNFLVGFSAGFVGPLRKGELGQTFEVGLHVGYAWNP